MKIKPCIYCPLYYSNVCDIPSEIIKKTIAIKPSEVKMFTSLNMQCKKYKEQFKPGDHVIVTVLYPSDDVMSEHEEEYDGIFSKWMGGKHAYKAKIFVDFGNGTVGKDDVFFMTPDHEKRKTGFIMGDGFSEVCPVCGKPKRLKGKNWICDVKNEKSIDCEGNIILEAEK